MVATCNPKDRFSRIDAHRVITLISIEYRRKGSCPLKQLPRHPKYVTLHLPWFQIVHRDLGVQGKPKWDPGVNY